ncbi:threonyl-tRNA synthetase [Kribbella flavida DSM 17836]|uniref:Threonine--tRNA ligase n=1 Tax=Kribbella flavida (strain DSM 17836 / JCM 10339 / NBRC 14399) TaxID=479435 RepID=D2PKY6_KRIFD|nr:threonine--tRNA ligase [Kribbella flavida]ADB32453.1 threonyl-tRNA synthetase [Kribbella flavida DSM 17836]
MYDHRKLGRELGLFDSDPLIGAGLPYLLPAGAAIRQALESYVAELERRSGYQHVYSPVLGKRELYELSGHWSHYSDDMYPPMKVGEEEVVLRPSLCPHHALIYRSRAHSYRELPVRYAELGGMYRSELSGVLGGLTRVRAIQLNDGHIFCTLDQVADEARAALDLILRAYGDLGLRPARFLLSLPAADARIGDPASKYVGDAESWDRSAALLREVLDEAGVQYEEAPGEAAFYGPKIDVQIADAAGRESTLSTIQIDFHQPARFELDYIGADGNKHRPVMVHRAIIGSLERVIAQLIELHGGALPGWLAPVQLVVLPISDAEEKYAAEITRRAVDRGLRAELAHADEGTLGARIRENRLVPYQAVIGARELEAGQLAVRDRSGSRYAPAAAGDVLDQLAAGCRPAALSEVRAGRPGE